MSEHWFVDGMIVLNGTYTIAVFLGVSLPLHLCYTGIMVWLTCQTPAVGGLILCECVGVCVSEDMSPYCSVHDEWLIMKLCMYVGYHDAKMCQILVVTQ